MGHRYDRKRRKNKSLIWIILGVIFLGALAFVLFQRGSEEVREGDSMETKKIEIPKNLPLSQAKEKTAVNRGSIADEAPSTFGETKLVNTKADEPATHAIKIKPKLTELKLEESDGGFKLAVSGVSKKLADWFGSTAVIRKYIVAINDLSQNQIIYKHRFFIKEPSRFLVKKDGQGLYMAEESYARYDQFTNSIVSIDVEKGLGLYLTFEPLFTEVYKEFAYPKEYQLKDIFLKAAASVINAPIKEGRVGLVKHSIRYKYADKKLEALSDVDKLMLRMGPENTKKIQAKLRQLVQAIAVLNE